MEFGICNKMCVALRAQPSHASEMVSQLLFGESYQVIDSCFEWKKIQTADCHYLGWISEKQHTPISEKECTEWEQGDNQRVKFLYQNVHDEEQQVTFPICLGAKVPLTIEKYFTMAGKRYTIGSGMDDDRLMFPEYTEQQNELLSVAYRYLNTPYLWGGRTPAGIDCSGFTQNVFQSIGVQLPRDASQQVHVGDVVDFVEEARVGDVAFFENNDGAIVHVGIICGKNQIIHASGCVQVNTIDNSGIFHHNLGKYTHQLRIIKRIL